MTTNDTTTNDTKRIPAVAAEINGTELVFTGDNGDRITVNAMALDEEIKLAAMMHGLKQKIGDAAAISRNPDTGRSATTGDKFDAMREVFERLTATRPQWNKTREGGDGGAGGLLFKALCKIKSDKTPAEVRAYLEARTKEEQAALRKVPAIAAAIEEIKAANAKDGGIDGEALLAGF